MERIETRPPELAMPPTMQLAEEREQSAPRMIEFSPLAMAVMMFDGEDLDGKG